MKKQEAFPVSKEIVEKFIELNKGEWKDDSTKNRYVYVNFSMVRMQISWIVPKLIFAKGIQEKTGDKAIVLTWDDNELLTKFFDSFAMKHFAINTICRKDIISGIKALLVTFAHVMTHNSGESIKRMKVCGLGVGKDIYEDILRTSSLSTLKTCRNKIAIKKMFHIIWAMYSLKRFNKKYPGEYAVMDDFTYHEAAFIKLYNSLQMKVTQCSNFNTEDVLFDEKGNIVKQMIKLQKAFAKALPSVTEENVKEAEKMINDRFSGKNGRAIDRGAFVGKKVLSKEELANQFKLDKDKKTIVIMAHTFTDAVYNYGDYYFRDYYDWLEETLSIAENVTSVNWILKPHPTRGAYNESEDSIEMMYERHKKDNIYFMSDDISSESIKNVADALVTIGGNAGAEYACFGIPPIIVGAPWYSGVGYTIEPKTYDEYRAILEHVDEVTPLTDEQIVTAKKMFYLKNTVKRNSEIKKDPIYIALNSKYSEMIDEVAIGYFTGTVDTKEYNNEQLEAYIANMDKAKDCFYYRKGNGLCKERGL